MGNGEVTRFRPGWFLAGGDVHNGATADMLILNQPIASFEVFAQLWRHVRFCLCVDGGANRLYDMFEGALEARRAEYLPDSIHGDLDSLRDDVREYYAALGVKVTQDPDQYSTDFGKAMHQISLRHSHSYQREVLILGSLAGRVDQGLGLLHEMIREERRDRTLRLWLVTETSISFILKSGNNVIDTGLSSGVFTKHTGLVPVYGPATITTSGLEWDVKDWETSMGTQVSTSNHILEDEVHVHTTAPILFTAERGSLLKTKGAA